MPPKAKLTREALDVRLRVIHQKTPRPEQLIAIDTLFNEEKDVVLIAKTGYGKSMVFHSVSALQEGAITLMTMPLLALEEDQKSVTKKMQTSSNPCIVNGETMTKELLDEIKPGIYIHVVTSPKTAISNKAFRKILQHQDFEERLIPVAIDEVDAMDIDLADATGEVHDEWLKADELDAMFAERVRMDRGCEGVKLRLFGSGV